MEESALNVMTRSSTKWDQHMWFKLLKIDENTHKMKWRTIIEVAKIFPDDATVTQAECTAAVEAARAICCLARTGRICFDLDGKLIEDWRGNKTTTRNKMKEDRWKEEKEEVARLSHP